MGWAMGGSGNSLDPPAWLGFQSPLGLWSYGPEWEVHFCLISFLENMVGGPPNLWEICAFIFSEVPQGYKVQGASKMQKISQFWLWWGPKSEQCRGQREGVRGSCVGIMGIANFSKGLSNDNRDALQNEPIHRWSVDFQQKCKGNLMAI